MSKNTKAGMERNKDKVAELVANGTQPLPEVLAPLVGVHERTIRNYLKEMELEPHNSELRQRGALAILGMIADKLDELENDHLIRTDVVREWRRLVETFCRVAGLNAEKRSVNVNLNVQADAIKGFYPEFARRTMKLRHESSWQRLWKFIEEMPDDYVEEKLLGDGQ